MPRPGTHRMLRSSSSPYTPGLQRRSARLASSSCGRHEYSRCTRQRQTDVRQKHRLMPPTIRGGGIIKGEHTVIRRTCNSKHAGFQDVLFEALLLSASTSHGRGDDVRLLPLTGVGRLALI